MYDPKPSLLLHTLHFVNALARMSCAGSREVRVCVEKLISPSVPMVGGRLVPFLTRVKR